MKQKQFNVKLLRIAVILSLVLSITTMANAQTEVSVGADVVNNYIWRGLDLGGVSVQPGITVSRNGLSLTAWGSVGLESADTKEFDLTFGYGIGGFSAAITDYWFNTDNNRYFNYGEGTVHIYEVTLGYDFGLLSFNWSTNFAGADDIDGDDKNDFSSYAEVAVPFKLGGYDFSVEAGLTPWKGAYSNNFNVVNIGLKASKNITVTESFTIPAFAKVVVNPNTENAYLAFGVTF
jgi:hypothetical protein